MSYTPVTGALALEDPAVIAYHEAMARACPRLSWFGVPIEKQPTDLLVYQELLAQVRPQTIIETGTSAGGSAIFLATMAEALGLGKVISIDIVPRPVPAHPRVQYIMGVSSTAKELLDHLRSVCVPPVMVFLDSDHRAPHVLEELRAYAPLVTRGSYLVVEDGNVNGHPVSLEHGPGPYEATMEFMVGQQEFMIDTYCHRFGMTCNPYGYLRRIAGGN